MKLTTNPAAWWGFFALCLLRKFFRYCKLSLTYPVNNEKRDAMNALPGFGGVFRKNEPTTPSVMSNNVSVITKKINPKG
ncbi:hypothetical protein LNO89_23665 [Klebsiella pneumoniae subsp. pneumoniae]|nr:hypothetical protein [Klebsiella pneumoniae subsp. pneumoniae]